MLKPVDDFDGTVEGVEHISFGYKGEAYGIDLSPANQEAFDKLIQPYIDRSVPHGTIAQENGQRTGRPRTNGASATRVAGTVERIVNGASYDDVRAWARKKKLKVAEKGRLSNEVIVAFNEAHTDK